MELRIFDDEFLEQQLKEIDSRTKQLLKIDTSKAPPQLAASTKSKLPQVMTASKSTSNLTLDMRALTQSTESILKNVLKNARTTVNLTDEGPDSVHNFEVRSLLTQKNKIIDSLKRKNRMILESEPAKEVRR